MKTAAQLAIEESQKGRRQEWAIKRMLHHLKEWVLVRHRNEDVHIGNVRIDWATGIGKGPGAIIQQAIAECPELWAHAIPEGCIVVPKETLKMFLVPTPAEYGGTEYTLEFLAEEGANLVANKAAQIRYLREEEERKKRDYGDYGDAEQT